MNNDVAYGKIKCMKGMERSYKILLTLISVFTVAIVGLSVGIVMVKMYKQGQGQGSCSPDGSGGTNVTVDDPEEEAASEIVGKLSTLSTEEALKFLEEKQVEYAGTNLAYSIMFWKVGVYEEADMTEEAILFLEAQDISSLDYREKWSVYYELSELYKKKGDTEKANYYLEKSEEEWSSEPNNETNEEGLWGED